MGVLDQVVKMKTEGKSELEIISYLKNQGVSPKDIQNALSQSQIKDAVYDMQQSIMDDNPSIEETYVPQAYNQNMQNQPPQQNQYQNPTQYQDSSQIQKESFLYL